jgi:hypothetical protein
MAVPNGEQSMIGGCLCYLESRANTVVDGSACIQVQVANDDAGVVVSLDSPSRQRPREIAFDKEVEDDDVNDTMKSEDEHFKGDDVFSKDDMDDVTFEAM